MVVRVEGEEVVKQDNLLKLTKIMRTSRGSKVYQDLRRCNTEQQKAKKMTSMMRVKASEVVRVWE